MPAKTDASFKTQRTLTVTSTFPQAMITAAFGIIILLVNFGVNPPYESSILLSGLAVVGLLLGFSIFLAGLFNDQRLRKQRVTYDRYLTELSHFSVIELANQPLYDKANAVAAYALASDTQAKIIIVLADNGMFVRSNQEGWTAASTAAARAFEGKQWPRYFNINFLDQSMATNTAEASKS